MLVFVEEIHCTSQGLVVSTEALLYLPVLVVIVPVVIQEATCMFAFP